MQRHLRAISNSWPDTELFLGRPTSFWFRVRAILDLHQIDDPDQLAFKLLSRCTQEERQRIAQELLSSA